MTGSAIPIRADEFPDEDPRLLALISAQFRDLFDAVQRVQTFGAVEGRTFTTNAGGTAYLDIKTDRKPSHVVIGKLAQSDATEITAAWSQTWVARQDGVRILFVGLAANTKHVCSVLYL